MNGCSTEEGTQGSSSNPDAVVKCCLIDDGERCIQPAGNASFNKRIQKTVTQNKLKLNIDIDACHIYICEFHKSVIQSIRSRRKRKDDVEDDNASNDQDVDVPEQVDFNQIPISSLRRYKRHYKLQSRPGINKAQLAETVASHFKNIPVVEKDVISCFIHSVKNNMNKLDQKNGAEASGN